VSSGARVLSIGLASPEARLDSAQSLALAERLGAGPEDAERLATLHRRTGIEGRGCVLARGGAASELMADAGRRGPSTGARLEYFLETASALGTAAAAEALGRAELDSSAVTHLVTVSCTGAGSPGVDRELIVRLGLSPEVRRTHVGFMGCHGAINALAVADSVARADPGAVVLVACVEVCSLHYHVAGRPDQDVANAIFADGAACAVVAGSAGRAAGGWPVGGFAGRIFPGTADLMGWEIGDHGFEMHLSPRVPGVLRRHVGPWVESWLAREGLSVERIAGWAVHPGGRDILEGVRRGLGLGAGALWASEGVLRERGNMSSGTVLWVIDRLVREGCRGPIAALAFGPGLAGEGLLVHA
jgi:predicted naringenin-chalcone synthase